jgi:hypothetical protein
MASEHFMQGQYCTVLDRKDDFLALKFSEGRYCQSEFSGGSRHISHMLETYDLDGDTVRITDQDAPFKVWHYRNFDGVAVLLSPRALAIYEKSGGFLPEHQNNAALWEEVMVRGNLFHFSEWPRRIREHPRFAAALPPGKRSAGEIPWTRYLHYRWFDYLWDHPELRERLPKFLRADE